MSQARMLAVRAACAALISVPVLALADPLACGVYRTEDGTRELHIESTATATELSDYRPPRPLAYRADGTTVQAYDLEAAYTETWTPGSDGRLRTEMGEVYTLTESADCALPPPAPVGSCRADPAGCFEAREQADEATLARWCDQEGLPFACSALIEHFQAEADRHVKGGDLPEGTPPECVEGSAGFSESACEATIKQALARAFADAFKGMYADDAPLAPAHLDRSLALCLRNGSAKVCNEAAEKLWTGGRYLDARTALTAACGHGKDKDACGRIEPLAGLSPADQQAPATDRLPCGQYTATGGLMPELGFGDAGRVEAGFGSVMRARLEDGLIRIRHDKGGDFVFRAIAGDRLLGLDGWNRYAVYRRGDGGAERCAPPRQFAERPLLEDCPAVVEDGGADACCKAGRLQGCDALGHASALADDWTGAQPHYLRICATGVRVGCENLAQVYAHTGDGSVIEAMQDLCAKDDGHVACDVLETFNWESMGLNRALDDVLREIEQQIDAPDQEREGAAP